MEYTKFTQEKLALSGDRRKKNDRRLIIHVKEGVYTLIVNLRYKDIKVFFRKWGYTERWIPFSLPGEREREKFCAMAETDSLSLMIRLVEYLRKHKKMESYL